MQHFFIPSSGATRLSSKLQTSSSPELVASAIFWEDSKDKRNYITIKIVKFGKDYVNLKISISGLDRAIQSMGSKRTVLTFANERDENSFDNPRKVVPVTVPLVWKGKEIDVVLQPYYLTSFDLLKGSSYDRTLEADAVSKSGIQAYNR